MLRMSGSDDEFVICFVLVEESIKSLGPPLGPKGPLS